MLLRRTANAGVLLTLDGVMILLDGVCREVKPYPATPPEERAQLTACFPDIVAFTHAHKDHYDPAYAAEYLRQTGRVLLGPEGIRGGQMTPVTVRNVTVTPVPSRHIGAAGKTTPHTSFLVRGSKTILFTGDAAPSQWRRSSLPKPDVLVVPYAYALTPAGWQLTQSLGAESVVLLHLPERKEDAPELWQGVTESLQELTQVQIPNLSQELNI